MAQNARTTAWRWWHARHDARNAWRSRYARHDARRRPRHDAAWRRPPGRDPLVRSPVPPLRRNLRFFGAGGGGCVLFIWDKGKRAGRFSSFKSKSKKQDQNPGKKFGGLAARILQIIKI